MLRYTGIKIRNIFELKVEHQSNDYSFIKKVLGSLIVITCTYIDMKCGVYPECGVYPSTN